jgi:aminopeptidase N
MFLVGELNFSAALSQYFNAFAWTNATIDDLLKKLEPSFPTSIVGGIDQWKKDWLLTASLNVI